MFDFQPTWTFFGPAFGKSLLPEITSDHFSSLKTLIFLGAPTSMDFLASIQVRICQQLSNVNLRF